jgi:hypothetical protein|tara:strand:- start:199 stop:411 length:213 start_codon:yes stop_codon:yes gene_type:complete
MAIQKGKTERASVGKKKHALTLFLKRNQPTLMEEVRRQTGEREGGGGKTERNTNRSYLLLSIVFVVIVVV